MKTAVCYYSRHHGNTRKVLDAMAGEGNLDLIDVLIVWISPFFAFA